MNTVRQISGIAINSNCEIWTNTRETYGNYEISNYGNMRIPRVEYFLPISKTNKVKNSIPVPIYIAKNKVTVKLRNENRKYKSYNLALLVAKHFVPNPFNKTSLRFLDSDFRNVAAKNLEWIDHSHAIAISKSKISSSLIKQIMLLNKMGYTVDAISKITNVSASTIRNFRTGKKISGYDPELFKPKDDYVIVQSKINLPEEEYNLYMAQKEKE
jgi:hypothetical protein